MRIEMEVSMPSFRVFDFHAHFPYGNAEYLDRYCEKYIADNGRERYQTLSAISSKKNRSWMDAWCFPEPEEDDRNWEITSDRWMKEIARNNLEGIVFVTGGGNDILGRVIAGHPDIFHGFVQPEPEENPDGSFLETTVKQHGFKGIKLFAPLINKELSDPCFYKFWETVEHLGLPVLIHFGILGGFGGIGAGKNINPLSLHDVAKSFPSVSFIVPHFGCGYPRELLQLCWACPNVMVDSSGNNEWVRWMPYDLSLKQLFKRFYETVGPGRIIFGSDSEWFPRGFAVRYLLDQLRACRELNIPEEHIRQIFRENGMALIGLQPSADR